MGLAVRAGETADEAMARNVAAFARSLDRQLALDEVVSFDGLRLGDTIRHCSEDWDIAEKGDGRLTLMHEDGRVEVVADCYDDMFRRFAGGF